MRLRFLATLFLSATLPFQAHAGEYSPKLLNAHVSTKPFWQHGRADVSYTHVGAEFGNYDMLGQISRIEKDGEAPAGSEDPPVQFYCLSLRLSAFPALRSSGTIAKIKDLITAQYAAHSLPPPTAQLAKVEDRIHRLALETTIQEVALTGGFKLNVAGQEGFLLGRFGKFKPHLSQHVYEDTGASELEELQVTNNTTQRLATTTNTGAAEISAITAIDGIGIFYASASAFHARPFFTSGKHAIAVFGRYTDAEFASHKKLFKLDSGGFGLHANVLEVFQLSLGYARINGVSAYAAGGVVSLFDKKLRIFLDAGHRGSSLYGTGYSGCVAYGINITKKIRADIYVGGEIVRNTLVEHVSADLYNAKRVYGGVKGQLVDYSKKDYRVRLSVLAEAYNEHREGGVKFSESGKASIRPAFELLASYK